MINPWKKSEGCLGTIFQRDFDRMRVIISGGNKTWNVRVRSLKTNTTYLHEYTTSVERAKRIGREYVKRLNTSLFKTQPEVVDQPKT